MVTQVATVLTVFRGARQLLTLAWKTTKVFSSLLNSCPLGQDILESMVINPAFFQNFVKATEDCSHWLSSGWLVNS